MLVECFDNISWEIQVVLIFTCQVSQGTSDSPAKRKKTEKKIEKVKNEVKSELEITDIEVRIKLEVHVS